MTDATPAAEKNADEAPAPVHASVRGRTHHLLVAGAALTSMAFVLGLWLIRGGSLGMLLGEEATLAGSVTAAGPVERISLTQEARIAQPLVAQRPVPAATPTPGQPAQPIATAPNGMPVFVTPRGVINPLTLLHDPAYYQQWARVGATYANPFAYPQIMTLMMRHAMQAWGMGPPITAAIDDESTPHG